MEKATRDGRGWKIGVSFVVGAGGGSEEHMNHSSFLQFSASNLRVENTLISLQKQKILRRGGKNIQKNYTKKIFMTQTITMV